MPNSPFDPDRRRSTPAPETNLCAFYGCRKQADEQIPNQVSLCLKHWFEFGRIFNDEPMYNRFPEVEPNLRNPMRGVGDVLFCLDCGEPPHIDDAASMVHCQACGSSTTVDAWRAEVDRRALLAQEAHRAKYVEAERKRRAEEACPVVYYIRFGDRIKIGTSTNLKKRLGGVPYDEILAVEPGSYKLEAMRHRQFDRYRLTGEWFSQGKSLMNHIEQVRQLASGTPVAKAG